MSRVNHSGMSQRIVVCGAAVFLAAVFAFCAPALADKVTLKDGRTVYGRVINAGDPVWVKTDGGETRKIPKKDVKSIERGITAESETEAGAATQAGPGARKPGATAATTRRPAAPRRGSSSFSAAENRARHVTTPLAAVAIWQEFIDSKPPAEELKRAREEMARWQKFAETEAEKINGKWVGGEERKALIEQAIKLTDEGFQLMSKDQTLQALEKLQEANKIYPNSFRSNFLLGYLMILQHKTKEATKYFEQALKLNPDSPEALANLALIYIDKKQYGKAIQMLHKAVQGRDSEGIALNLCFAISIAPRNIQNSKQLQPAIEAARLMSAKYGIPLTVRQYAFVGLPEEEAKSSDPNDALAGGMSSGTGFIINDDGLILTNRHVVDGGKTFMVRLNDDKLTQASAEVVVMDDEQDLALVRMKLEDGRKLPVLSLSAADNPADGANCTVMGFPLITRLGASIKVTRGVVSSGNSAAIGPDVVLDVKVNPGNSGGPVLDERGDVMAVISMKSLASAIEDSYGLAISAGDVRKFLEKNNITVKTAEPPGPTAIALSTEQVAARARPATVCILATR